VTGRANNVKVLQKQEQPKATIAILPTDNPFHDAALATTTSDNTFIKSPSKIEHLRPE